MNYLLDKKNKRKKYIYISVSVVALFFVMYFRAGIFSGFSSGSYVLLRPVVVLGNSIGGRFRGLRAYFASKSSLSKENADLQLQIDQNKAEMANYNSVISDNASLQEILARKKENIPMIVAAILSKPNQSPYDTLIIDGGSKSGIRAGERVFALGNVPIGRVDLVYASSAKVILFSSSGERTQVVSGAKNGFMEIVGRGGGNFEMILPRDFNVQKGDEVSLPGITPYVVARVETTISDLRDPFQKALLVSPVNVQELKFVEVESY